VKALPETDSSLVLRTDFSDEPAWKSIASAIQQPAGNFVAHVSLVSSPEYRDVRTEEVASLIPSDWNHTFLFIVDSVAISHPEHPILVVDFYAEPGRTFRVIPSEIWGVENNLSLANMDFSAFANAAGDDGIFRGF